MFLTIYICTINLLLLLVTSISKNMWLRERILTRPQCYHLCKIVLIEKLIKLTKDNFTASKRLLIGCITSHIQYKKNHWNWIYIFFFVKKQQKRNLQKAIAEFSDTFPVCCSNKSRQPSCCISNENADRHKTSRHNHPFELHDGICHYRLMLSLLSVRISILQEYWNRCAQLKRALVHIHCNAESCVRVLVSNWMFNYVKLSPL